MDFFTAQVTSRSTLGYILGQTSGGSNQAPSSHHAAGLQLPWTMCGTSWRKLRGAGKGKGCSQPHRSDAPLACEGEDIQVLGRADTVMTGASPQQLQTVLGEEQCEHSESKPTLPPTPPGTHSARRCLCRCSFLVTFSPMNWSTLNS